MVNIKTSVGIVLGLVLVVSLVGYLIFNPLNSNTSQNNGLILVNQTEDITTNSDDILPSNNLLMFFPFSSRVTLNHHLQ